MGDYSNFSIYVHGVKDPRVIAAIKDEVDGYGGDSYEEDVTDTSLGLGYNEVRVGTVEEVHSWLHELVEKGLEIEQCLDLDDATGHECALGVDHDGDHDYRPDDEVKAATTVPVGDFYWRVNDEPKYEWLGSICFHSPGVGDFVGMCDAEGRPIINTGSIEAMVEEATDLDALKERVRNFTGAAVTDAFYAAAKEA